MLFIILSLSLLGILNADNIHLTKGVTFNQIGRDLTDGNNNKYYIEASKNQLLNGTISLNYVVFYDNTIVYFYICEANDFGIYISQKSKTNSFKFKKNETDYSFNFTYSPSSDRTSRVYFYFEIYLTIFNELNITVDVNGDSFDLLNGIPSNFYNLSAEYPYYFNILFRDIKIKNANLSLSLDYNPIKPFKSLFVYEYSSKFTNEKNIPISYEKVNDKDIIFLPYIISSQNIYSIAFKIVPEYNIDNIWAKITLGGGLYDIDKSNPENISNITAGNNYYFYLQVKEKQLVKIDLKMNYMKNIPFDYINISEYINKEIINKNTTQDIKLKYKNINDEYIISFQYSIFFYNTNYISFDILPKYDIDYITINAEIEGGAINCTNGVNCKLNILPEYPYYLFIKAKEKQKLNITISMENMMNFYKMKN
jgi:hypothetical protein